MLEKALAGLRSRCDVARACRPTRSVLVESTHLHDLLDVYEAAAAVGKDASDENVERLIGLAVGLRSGA